MKKILLLLLTVSIVNAETLSGNLWKYTFFSLNNYYITIPEYIATYVVELTGYFFIVIIGFEILTLTFKYFSTGFNMQQLKPMLMQSFISLIIVLGIMFTPGVKQVTFTESNGQVNTIRTKLLVDMTSAFFASGSVIADVFAYELLFGKMPENKNLFMDGFKGANKNTKLEGFLIKMGIYSAYNIQNKVTLHFKNKNENINKMFTIMKDLLSPTHLDKYKIANENLLQSQTIINSIINNKMGNESSEISIGNNNNSYIVKNNVLKFTYNDFNGNEITINEDNVNSNNNITDDRIINFNKKVILALSKVINNTNNKYMDEIIKLKNDDLTKLYGQESFFNNDYYTIVKNDMLTNIDIYNDQSEGTKIYKLTKDYLNGKLPYNLDSFSNFVTTLTTYSKENDYLINKIKTIKDKIDKEQNDDYFINNFYSNFYSYYFDILDKVLNFDLPDNIIQNNQNYIKAMDIKQKNLYNDSEKWQSLQSEINNALTNSNNKNTLTLNDLYKESSFLTFFKNLGIGGDTLDELIKADTLPDNYIFHWVDLGKYYSGLKSIISNNYFTSLYLNDLLINKDISENDMNKFLQCLKLNPNLRNNQCQIDSFHSSDQISGIIHTTGKTVEKGIDAVGGGAKAIEWAVGGALVTILAWHSSTKAKGIISSIGAALKSVLWIILILLIITVSVYILVPLVFWYIAIINWFLKSSILLVSFCLSFIFLLIENKRQVVYNNIFHLIGQAMIPLFLVGMFFLIINLSNILDIAMFNALPLGKLTTSDSSSFIVKGILLVIKYLVQSLMTVLNIILTFNLFRYLWQIDEFVSEVIGTQINNSLIQPERIIHTFSAGHTEKFF